MTASIERRVPTLEFRPWMHATYHRRTAVAMICLRRQTFAGAIRSSTPVEERPNNEPVAAPRLRQPTYQSQAKTTAPMAPANATKVSTLATVTSFVT